MKKQEKGSILVFVIVLFAMVLILGTGLLGTVSYSQKISLIEENRQQAYYVAKSALDACKFYFEQENYIKSQKLVGKKSTIEMNDAEGSPWTCDIEIQEAPRNENAEETIVITATAFNKSGVTQVRESVQGMMKVNSSIDMNFDKVLHAANSLTLDVTNGTKLDPIEAGENLTIKGDTNNIKMKEIDAGKDIKITLGNNAEFNGKITSTGGGVDIKTYSGKLLITNPIEAAKLIKINHGGQIEIEANIISNEAVNIVGSSISKKDTVEISPEPITNTPVNIVKKNIGSERESYNSTPQSTREIDPNKVRIITVNGDLNIKLDKWYPFVPDNSHIQITDGNNIPIDIKTFQQERFKEGYEYIFIVPLDKKDVQITIQTESGGGDGRNSLDCGSIYIYNPSGMVELKGQFKGQVQGSIYAKDIKVSSTQFLEFSYKNPPDINLPGMQNASYKFIQYTRGIAP
ncbi:MAG: hypothetical protein H9893_04280 [Candidatus Niameybacter stercoravium]|nr:hypothetical protein [Candidatus Niameybacter stercoravium]